MKVVTTKDVEQLKMTGVFGTNTNPTSKSVKENADGTAGESATAKIKVKLFFRMS